MKRPGRAAADPFDADAYAGTCSICGLDQVFTRTDRAIRETYRCARCQGLLREREQARALLACYPHVQAATLEGFVATSFAQGLRIFEPGTIGAFRPHLAGLPGYQRSDFYDDPARATPDLPHESLEALSLADESLDLVVTSDILEHVARPAVAFAEIARVLRVGGYHVFTVPFDYPLRTASVTRAVVDGGREVHLLPPRYHGDGKGGRSLVYTDFGLDVVAMLAEAGMDGELQRAETPSTIASRAITVVCRRAR